MGVASLPLFCCSAGLSGAIAIALGLLALDRIRASGGVLRGRGLAWTGMLTGLATMILAVVWASAVESMHQNLDRELDGALKATFGATDDASAREALAGWSPSGSDGLSAAQVQRFAADVRARLGALDTVGLVSQQASPSLLGDHLVTHMVTLDFEKGRRSAVGTARIQTSLETWTPTRRLAGIHITEPDQPGGELVLPARREQSPRESSGQLESEQGQSSSPATRPADTEAREAAR